MNTENPPRPHDPDDETDPAAAGIDVEVSDTQSHLKIDHEALANVVRETLQGEGVGLASISLAIVDDRTIRAINRRHLDHDWPTDVISFVLSDPDDGAALAGELVVSAETAAAAAGQAGVSARDELALYVVHGLLHLCGYDDLTAEGRGAMRRREGEILARLGLSNTYPTISVADPVGAAPGVEAGARESARWTV